MTSSRANFVALVVAAAFVVAGLTAPALARQTQPGERAEVTADTDGRLHWKKGKKKKKKKATKKKSSKKKSSKKNGKDGKSGAAAEPAATGDDGAAGEPTPEEAVPAKKKKTTRAERIGTERVAGAGAGAGGATPLRRSNRMEFDARVVRGETAGSGAVILFERGPRHLATLTQRRKIFLDATIDPILGKEASASPRHKKSTDKDKKKKKDKKKDKPD